MAIQIGMERSMFHEPVARRIGATSRSLHQELITGALASMDSYISDEHQVDNMYGTFSYPLIAAGDVHLVGENHVPQDGKIPQQNVADFSGTSGGRRSWLWRRYMR
uniref:Uncharacterized protein n=1 Tax=Setaria italica TaxID=4555 RepID=K3ZB16_SETIT